MDLVVRYAVVGVSDQVIPDPTCSATETGLNSDVWNVFQVQKYEMADRKNRRITGTRPRIGGGGGSGIKAFISGQ